MADFLFIVFVLSMLFLFIYKSYQLHKSKYASTRDINKYYKQKIALGVKHRAKVPHYDADGNLYTTTKQCADGVGVYSKEYHEELRDLNNITF